VNDDDDDEGEVAREEECFALPLRRELRERFSNASSLSVVVLLAAAEAETEVSSVLVSRREREERRDLERERESAEELRCRRDLRVAVAARDGEVEEPTGR